MLNHIFVDMDAKKMCSDCTLAVKNRWLCLGCAKVSCGKQESKHALLHHIYSGHALVINCDNLSVWCYECIAYVNNQKLSIYQNWIRLNANTGSKSLTDCPHLRSLQVSVIIKGRLVTNLNPD